MGHHLRSSADVSGRLIELLRRIGRRVTGGLVAAGACWYGGYAMYASWASRSTQCAHRDLDREVAREAARGISEIEVFIATRADRQRERPS